MARLSILLTNPEGLRLSVAITVSQRNTSTENEARKRVEVLINADNQHSKHGPWVAAASHYTSA